ncbi:MAG: hypothetical protein D8M58_17175 [Calditrichaeota bacterium]|nr:MAG: hypothetical protein DWQ03_12305 [Calditrichota bacterium]MBL1207140.1 hypothetical protein [Calditrichota bacterium]NOG46970.1 hypothetical protein [Calditrichota bacterium]
MYNLREKLISEFKKIVKAPEFEDVFYLLSRGDYYIDLFYNVYYILNDYENDEDIPFGFIYNNEFIETRDGLFEARAKVKRKLSLNSEAIAQDISKISLKLNTLCSHMMFDTIQKILTEYIPDLENEIRLKNEEDVDVQTYAGLVINGINVLGIDYEDLICGETDIKFIKERLGLDSNLLIMSEQYWFNSLNDKTKTLINAANQYLNKMYFSEDKKDIIDFSPLLFDFLKAVEIEISEHFNYYFDGILKTASRIINSDLSNEKKLEKDLWNLKKIASGINKYKKGFRPDGVKTLFFLLYYFALGSNLKSIYQFQSYLPERKFDLLKKEDRLLRNLGGLGFDRNKLVHEKMIYSENEFVLIYNDIVLVLKLLTELKN